MVTSFTPVHASVNAPARLPGQEPEAQLWHPIRLVSRLFRIGNVRCQPCLLRRDMIGQQMFVRVTTPIL